jgi:xanthine dehydrogenase accessory factor
MTDLDQILPLWRELRDAGTEYVLATVVAVDGSGYRKPGARMLIGADGRRAGTVSGGCLEGEVARKAFWHTENGPTLRRYSTTAEDGEVPFGMGCGGIVHLLLERSATAVDLLERLDASFEQRLPLAVATVLDGAAIGSRAFFPLENDGGADAASPDKLADLARQCFEERRSFPHTCLGTDGRTLVRAEWCEPRPGLFVFGAGDDTVPLVKQARQLGWYVAVADGRSHLATRARFPEAQDVHVIDAHEFSRLELRPTDAAVLMTHSLEQDTRILGELLGRNLAYLGVLGPRRRTGELLAAVANNLDLPLSRVDAQVESWMERLHAPIGLDLGGDTPAEIALSVIAEIQQSRHRASGLPLHKVRGRHVESIATCG